MKNSIKLLLAVTLTTSLSGCSALSIFTGAEAAKTFAEERSTGSRVDDNGIALAINDKFIQKDFDGLFGSVSTDIKEGRVLLTGKVRDEMVKKEATRLVWEVNGVKEVINELQTDDKGSVTKYMQDAWISNQIKTRMLFTKGVMSINYNISVVNQVVYIMGISQSQQELNSVIEIARRTKGVLKVVNHAILKDDPRRGVWSEQQKVHTPQ